MRRYLVLVAGVLTQLILGSIYAWSEIAANLTLQWDLVSWQTQLLYGMSIAVFSFGTIGTGPLVRRLGPRRITLVSAAVFAVAFAGAWASRGNFILLVPSIGLGVGGAMAFGYVVPLATATAWFPEHKGTVTGLAVMGFGGGAIAASRVIRILTEQGWGIAQVLLFLGLAGGAVLAFSALLQGFPSRGTSGAAAADPKGEKEASPPSIGKASRERVFWGLWMTMFLATIGGLIVIGSAVSIAEEWRLEMVVPLAVSALAAGNAGGRLLWGRLLDSLGHRAIPASLVLMALGFGLILVSGGSQILFLAGILLTGLQFGSALVIYAAFTEELFGSGAISRIYPYIFAAYGIAALVGPPAGGLIYDLSGSYRLVMLMVLMFPIIGLGVSLSQRNFRPGAAFGVRN